MIWKIAVALFLLTALMVMVGDMRFFLDCYISLVSSPDCRVYSSEVLMTALVGIEVVVVHIVKSV